MPIISISTRAAHASELITSGAACSGGNTSAADWDTLWQCVGGVYQRTSPFLASGIAIGTTTLTTGSVLDMHLNTNSMLLPVGTTGQEPSCSGSLAGGYRYNSTTNAPEFCNSSSWSQLVQVQSTPVVPAPAGSGYFVLTGTTYTGNLGGLAGANALCLTELRTTNTNWQGHTQALVRLQLVAAKVFAFLCTAGTCNNLSALTTYYFANAGNSSAGGASFTTDASGNGPNDSATWAGANYFGGTYTYWVNRAFGTPTVWPSGSQGSGGCSNWASSSSGSIAFVGVNANTNNFRWNTVFSYPCNTALPLICYVNP